MKTSGERTLRRCLNALLHLYPKDFRRKYGADLADTYVDRLSSLQGRNSRLALPRTIALAAWHSLRDGLLERLAVPSGESRARRRLPVMEAALQDLRHAVRSFARKPAFLTAVLLIFALGIGANTVIFSLVNGVLLRPLPYAEPDQLIMPWQTHPHWLASPNPSLRAQWDRLHMAYPVYEDWLAENTVFDAIGILSSASYVATEGDAAELIQGTRATHGVFKALGVPPMLGRTFLPEEDVLGGPRLVVLSYGTWQSRFGADSNVVGRAMELDEQSHTIVGVMPQGFYFPDDSEIWVTFPDSDRERRRNNQFALTVARLKPGITLERAQLEMEALQKRLNEVHPIPGRNYGVNLVYLYDEVVGDIKPALLLLLGTVGIFLVIACANIANLLLVRASERRRELAIRSSIGAGRSRLLRQLLTESLALSVAGGVLGAFLAMVTTGPLLTLLPEGTPRAAEVSLDHRVLLFAAGLSLLTGVLVGILPAVRAGRTRLTSVLQDSGRGSLGGARRNRTQATLLVFEIALTFVLLVGAGLLAKSFVRLTTVDRGFIADGILTMRVEMRGSRYSTVEQTRAGYRELRLELESIPGVTDVAESVVGPFMGGWSNGVTVGTRNGPVETNFRSNMVSESYYRVMGIPVLAGRNFSLEEQAGDVPAVIVSSELAHTAWPDEEAIGQRLKRGGVDSDSPWQTVVGIVGDVRRRLDTEPYPTMYFPLEEERNHALLIKTSLPPASLMPAVRNAVYAVDPNLPISQLESYEERIRRSVAAPRVRTVLMGALAGLAAALSVVGIFGVLAYAVAQRTNEIGIRMALGAETVDVVRGVLMRSLAFLGLGITLGLGVTLVAVRAVEGFLFEVEPVDPATLVTVVLLLTVAAMAASYVPARRATKVDPVEALRRE